MESLRSSSTAALIHYILRMLSFGESESMSKSGPVDRVQMSPRNPGKLWKVNVLNLILKESIKRFQTQYNHELFYFVLFSGILK